MLTASRSFHAAVEGPISNSRYQHNWTTLQAPYLQICCALAKFAGKFAFTVSCSRSGRQEPSPCRLTFSAPACPPSRLNSFSACQDIERAVRPRRSKGHSSDTSKSIQRRADLMGHSAGPTWCAAMPEPRLSSCTIGCAELQVLYCGSLSLMLHSISCFDVMDLVRCGMLTYS